MLHFAGMLEAVLLQTVQAEQCRIQDGHSDGIPQTHLSHGLDGAVVVCAHADGCLAELLLGGHHRLCSSFRRCFDDTRSSAILLCCLGVKTGGPRCCPCTGAAST